MHELAITQQLLQLASRQAAAAGAARVTGLSVAIGELSTFSEDAIGFCWEHVAQGTVCEGALVRFNHVSAELTCRDCGRVHHWQGEPRPCPHCGSLHLQISAGEDLLLESIDVEAEPASHG
jgi:hydrogenase nickel incorporation protein HypA/HybF